MGCLLAQLLRSSGHFQGLAKAQVRVAGAQTGAPPNWSSSPALQVGPTPILFGRPLTKRKLPKGNHWLARPAAKWSANPRAKSAKTWPEHWPTPN